MPPGTVYVLARTRLGVGQVRVLPPDPDRAADWAGTWLIDGAGYWVQQEQPDDARIHRCQRSGARAIGRCKVELTDTSESDAAAR